MLKLSLYVGSLIFGITANQYYSSWPISEGNEKISCLPMDSDLSNLRWSFEAKTQDSIYTIVDVMPRFPGCEEMKLDDEEKLKCSHDRLLKYLEKRLKYPREARKKKTEGIVFVQFIVTERGEISNVNLLNDIGDSCGDLALRIVKQMPMWNPGFKEGVPVKVRMNLPIQFKL